MIHRETDAQTINAIANRGDVRELMFLGASYPPQHLDFSAWVDDPRNIVLTSNGFGALFVFRGPGIYECHIMASKNARGSSSFKVGREMLNQVKAQGGKLVWGQPSVYNRAAICYIRRMGLRPVGFGTDAVAGEVQYFELEL